MLDTATIPESQLEIKRSWSRFSVWRFRPVRAQAPTSTVGATANDPEVAPAGASTDNLEVAHADERDPFADVKAKLNEIRAEGLASAAVLKGAESLLVALIGAALVPARTVLAADHEVSYVFFGKDLVAGGAHRLVVTISCAEDGLSMTFQNRESKELKASEIEMDHVSESLATIRAFVAGQ